MAYEKQTWTTGEVITAEKLNHMEDGIAGAGGGSSIEPLEITITHDDDAGTFTANKTYEELYNEWIVALNGNTTVDLNKINAPCVITYIDVYDGGQTTDTIVYDGLVAKTPETDANDGWGLALMFYVVGECFYSEDIGSLEYRFLPQGVKIYQHLGDTVLSSYN